MAYKRNDDLFQDTTMTFGEHLEELRTSLFKAVLGLVVGFAVGLMVGNHFVVLMAAPLTKALGSFYEKQGSDQYAAFKLELAAAGSQAPYSEEEVRKLVAEEQLLFDIVYVDPKQVNFEIARRESRSASTKDVAPSGADGKDTAEAIAAVEPGTPEKPPLTPSKAELVPILVWHPVETDSRVRIKSFSAPEAFSIWVKASLVVGVILSSPWVFYHIWAFVAAGLYPHEKRYVQVFLPFSLGLFLLGAATAYLFVFAPVLEFLFSFNSWLGFDPDPRISEWLGFVLLLPLGFGVSFQLPLVMLFLERIGVFDVQAYLEKWRISVLVIFILSAILTPADPYSLLLMALPLTVLYFGGVLLCRWMPRVNRPAEV
jgi:sec-independent protein translocase protein TatC